MRAQYHHGDLRIAAAEEAFLQVEQSGAESVSLRGVARGVGVSHAAVYRHFTNKRALLGEVARLGFVQLTTAVRRARERSPTPREGLIATARAYVRFALSHPGLYQVMFGPRLEGETDEPALISARRQAYAVVRDQLAAHNPDTADAQTIRVWALLHGFAELVQVDRLGIGGATGADRFIPELIGPILDADLP